jgi:hypothetical protein
MEIKYQNSTQDLTPEEKRNLSGFFELLLKVDKRVNPNLYKPIKSIISNPLLLKDINLLCKE